MPTARFQADFSSFLQAIDKAELALVDFSKGAGKVESSLNKMTDGFSGRKLIQEASLMTIAVEKAGGTSVLTAKEFENVGRKANEAADKMHRLGYDIPPGLQKLADATKDVGTAAQSTTGLLGGLERQLLGMFSIGAVVAFGKEVLDAGDKIQKMADQTGLSTTEVQKLEHIAGQSGVSIQSLIGAVQNLQVRLGDENTGAAGAMAKLGIESDAFNKLGTYQQMTTLGDAIKNIQDPTEQASIAAKLFGKSWKEILPAIKSGMEDVGNEATIMSETTVKALDRVGDSLKSAKERIVSWGGTFVVGVEEAGYAWGQFLSLFDPSHFGVTNDRLLKLAGSINDPTGLKGALVAVKAPSLDVGASIKVMGASSKETSLATLDLTEKAKASIEVHKAYAVAAKKAADEQERFRNSVQALSFKKFVTDGIPMVGLVRDISTETQAYREHLGELSTNQNEFHNGLTITGQEIATVTIPLFDKMGQNVVPTMAAAIKGATSEVEKASPSLKTLSGEFAKLAQIAGGSFGDIEKGVGTFLVSMDIMKNKGSVSLKELKKDWDELSKSEKTAATILAGLSVASGLVDANTKTGVIVNDALKGAQIGSIAGPIGTAIGAGVGTLVGLFTSLETKVNPVRQAFVDAAGGLAALDAKAAAAGVTLTALLNARTPEAYKKAIDDLNAAFDTQKAKINGANSELATLLSTAQTLGGTLPKTFDPAIQKLKDLGLITSDNAGLFERLAGSTGVDFHKLSEIAGKYGLDLASLGPKFQGSRLHDAAATIINDFDTLTRGGADVGGVLYGMRGNISKLVTDSLKFGVDIPANMQPWILELQRSGGLVDENGNKIDDLSGLKFADPIVTEFQKIVNKLQELIDKLGKPLVDAIANIPQPSPLVIPVEYSYGGGRGEAAYASRGGLVTASGIQYLGRGGSVLPFRWRGSDTVPAMLTPGERVLSVDQAKAYAAGGRASGDAGGLGSGAIVSELQGLKQQLADQARNLPRQIRDAVLLAG